MRISIAGAGAAGLTAAYELGKVGHQVNVYESAPFLGGQASTFEVNGARLERGYHHLFTSDTDILDLVNEIGLGHQMRWIEPKVGTLCDQKIYNFVTPMDLLTFKPISLINRFRLGLITLMLRKNKDWQGLEHKTADQWLRNKAGKEAYEVFWEPMLKGKFGNEHYDQVGMAWVWGKIHTRFASRSKGLSKEVLGYPIGSFGEIFDVLGKRIAEQGNGVHTSISVTKIVVEDKRLIGVEIKSKGKDPKLEKCDAVITTVPSHTFANMVPTIPEHYLSKLTNINYMAAVLIILVLERPLSSIYWLNIADRSIPFVGVIEHTNLIPPENYGGKHIVYISNYLSVTHPLYKMDHEELLQEYLPHLQKINPDFHPSWITKSYHHRVNAAQPIIGTNYSSRIPAHRTPFTGVYLANTTQIYPEDRGTNYSVRMGKKVADMVIKDLGKN